MSGPVSKELLVLHGGETMGSLQQNPHGRLSFTYSPEWANRSGATPLSLSMPLTKAVHSHDGVDAFLRGLLPDSEFVLQRWGLRFGVSSNSPFALLRHVGEDVAGAAQFIRPDRLEAATSPGRIEPVDEDYIENRLRVLRGDRAAWDDIAAPGQFSLAGAQAKFALALGPRGQWGLPSGRLATTHIFKPPLQHLAHQEVNEHLCLSAASLLGLTTARSEVMQFGDERAIVLERYDRIIAAKGDIQRRQQEDFCQALGIPPARKYQRDDGGPGIVDMVGLLYEHQAPSHARGSAERLVQALAYNWVIFGPDAHAKNYSLLLTGADVELAPLYDISSVAPYPDRYELRTMAMAMSVNGKYENRLITGEDWRALARALNLDPVKVNGLVYEIVANAADAFSDAIRAEQSWIGDLAMTSALVDGIAANSRSLLRFLERPTKPSANVAPRRRGRPVVQGYRKADGTWVSGYANPKFRG